MVEVPINITGGSSGYKSRSLSNQVTQNLVPTLIRDDITLKSNYILESFLGQKLFNNITGSPRGIFASSKNLFRVLDDKLYSVSASGAHSLVGGVKGSNRCEFCEVGDKLFITNGEYAYCYENEVFSEVKDGDYPNALTCTSLNSRVIVDSGDGSDYFYVSDVGAPESWNILNRAQAESDSDYLLAVKAFGQRLYLYGEKTIETWWNPSTSTDNPPFDRIEGGILQIGLGARYSLSSNDNGMYFLSDQNRIIFFNGSSYDVVSSDSFHYQISKYSKTDDAYGFCMTIRGKNYYVITFPTSDKTWVYPDGSLMFQWSSGLVGGKHNSNSYASAYGKNIIEDSSNGNLYELDPDTYLEGSNLIIKRRDTSPLTSLALGVPAGREFVINEVKLLMETRVGELSGQGLNPEISLQISYDGGRTFGNEYRAKIGNTNNDFIEVYWTNLGRGSEAVFRFTISDPVFVSIHSGVVDMELII